MRRSRARRSARRRPPARRVATTGLRAPRAPAARARRRRPRPRRRGRQSAGGSGASPRSRESHSSSAPAVNTPPSSAHSTSPLTRQATVGSSPPVPAGRSVPDVGEHEHARAVGGLRAARLDAARSRERGLLVRAPRAQRQLARPGRVAQRAQVAGGVGDLGQHLSRHAEDLEQVGVPLRRARAASATPSRGRCRTPRRAGRTGTSPPCPSAASRPRGRAPTVRVVLQQPGQLSGREVRVERQAAAASGSGPPCPPARAGRAPPGSACPATSRPASGRGRSRRPTPAPTRPGGRGRRRRPPRARPSSTSATASTTALTTILGILLHPTRPRVMQRLLAPRLAQRLQIGVEEDRLHGRGALVDAEQEAHRDAVLRRPPPPRHPRPRRRAGLERSLGPERHAEPLHQRRRRIPRSRAMRSGRWSGSPRR